MAKLTDLEIQIRATSTLQADLDKANRQIASFKNKTESGFAKIGDAIKGAFGVNLARLGTVAGLTALGAAFAGATKKAVAFASEINDTARNLGVSVEALQELRFAAQLSGVEVGSLDTALKFLNKNTSEAISGNTKIADAFDRLGISIGDLKTLNPEDLFGVVIEQLGKLPTAAERTRLSMELLGRSGNELGKLATESAAGIEVLRQQAIGLGAVLDEKTIKAFDDLGDKFGALFTLMKVRGVEALVLFTPLWERLATAILNADSIAGHALDVFKRLSELESVDQLNTRIETLSTKLANLREQLAFFSSDDPVKQVLGAFDFISEKDPQRLLETIQGLERELAEARARRDKLTEVPERLNDPIVGPRELNPPRDSGAAERAQRAAAREAARLAEIAAREVEAANARMAAAMQEESKILAETAERRLEAEAELAEALGNTEVAASKRAEIATARFERDRAQIVEVVQDAKTSQGALEDLAATRAAELAKIAAQEKKDWDDLKNFGIGGLSDALADLVLTGELTFQSLAQSFLREFVQVVIKQGIDNIADELAKLGIVKGVSAGVSAWFSSLFVGAEGGIVTRPTLSLIGEAGPEAVIPLDRLSTARESKGVEVHIHEAQGTKATTSTSRDGSRIDVQIINLVAENIASGGRIAQSAQKTWQLSRRGDRNG